MIERRFIAGIGALGLASSIWAVAPANAAPAKGEQITLRCDDGQTYPVTLTPGRGVFMPGFTADGPWVPIAFGTFSYVVRNASNAVVHTGTEAADDKGQSAKGVTNPVTCSYTVTYVGDGSDPMLPLGFTFTGTGTVVAKVPGR